MGGVGKTQCAIEYVYTSRSDYDRIYWVTAVDQNSVISGYQRIAQAVALPGWRLASTSEIAQLMISWLNQEKSWLLVIDNLDDIKVIEGLLPENGRKKHTLITTKNPNASGIPAEGLEVPLLDTADSIDLLSSLSNIEIIPGSPESLQAYEVVKNLGCLPLGIEEVAAYVREVAGDFSTFLDDYHRNHEDVHEWVPQGYRPYDHSVATTWFMSFNIVRESHP